MAILPVRECGLSREGVRIIAGGSECHRGVALLLDEETAKCMKTESLWHGHKRNRQTLG